MYSQHNTENTSNVESECIVFPQQVGQFYPEHLLPSCLLSMSCTGGSFPCIRSLVRCSYQWIFSPLQRRLAYDWPDRLWSFCVRVQVSELYSRTGSTRYQNREILMSPNANTKRLSCFEVMFQVHDPGSKMFGILYLFDIYSRRRISGLWDIHQC